MTTATLTKFEQVYDAVRARIQSGEYAPGRRLSFREIGQTLGASDIPVREAIHRLAAEGWVTYRPRHGVVVAGLTLAEIHELFLPHAILEGAVTRLAARHVSPSIYEQLAALVDEQRAAAAANATAHFAKLSVSFHDVLYAVCPARGLVESTEAIVRRTLGLRQITPGMYTAERMTARIAEHDALLRLLDARPLNLDRIEAFARRHKLRFFLNVVDGDLAAEVRRAELTSVLADAAE